MFGASLDVPVYDSMMGFGGSGSISGGDMRNDLASSGELAWKLFTSWNVS